MCGIVGIWSFKSRTLDPIVLEKYSNSLRHRGPDARGIFIDQKSNIGLGHQRLAILDITESGHQPMTYGDGRYCITFNGEIYNFLELREELRRLGHRFKSESDTEVILAAYAEWGEDCQYRFNGMWAFAIWDAHQRLLFLSRDRFGVKPLYYLRVSDYLLFASELKAFMALPKELKPEFDYGMVARVKNEESLEQTLLQGVNNLQAGCCLSCRPDGVPKIRKWWRTSEHLKTIPTEYGQQVEQFKELFYDSCKIRMRSDVAIGTALSGGLDSSSILCALSDIRLNTSTSERLAPDWQKAFVLSYAHTSNDERKFAEQVIHHTGVSPVIVEIDPHNISSDDLEAAIFSFEAIQNAEPSLGPWLIYQEMKKENVSVSIDGIGGDETLAGYDEYLPIALKDSIFPFPRPGRWNDLISITAGLNEETIENPRGNSIPTVIDVVKSLIPSMSETKDTVSGLLRKSPWLFSQVRSFYQALSGSNCSDEKWIRIDTARPSSNLRNSDKWGTSFLDRYMYDDFHYGSNARILRNFDRMSMAHGIESRGPYMDWRLACFCFSLPAESKLGNSFTKRILRDSMQGVLPESIRNRRDKRGFSSPMVTWYEKSLRNYVMDTLNSRQFLESGIWNGVAIRDFTEASYQKGNYYNATKSWRYIQAYVLMKAFYKASLEKG